MIESTCFTQSLGILSLSLRIDPLALSLPLLPSSPVYLPEQVNYDIRIKGAI